MPGMWDDILNLREHREKILNPNVGYAQSPSGPQGASMQAPTSMPNLGNVMQGVNPARLGIFGQQRPRTVETTDPGLGYTMSPSGPVGANTLQERFAAANAAQEQKMKDWILSQGGQVFDNVVDPVREERVTPTLRNSELYPKPVQQQGASKPMGSFTVDPITGNVVRHEAIKQSDWQPPQKTPQEQAFLAANLAQEQKLKDWIASQGGQVFETKQPETTAAPPVQQLPQSQRAAKPMSPLFDGPQSQPGMFGGPGQPKQQGDFLPAFGPGFPTQQRTGIQTDPGAGYANFVDPSKIQGISSPSKPNFSQPQNTGGPTTLGNFIEREKRLDPRYGR